MFEVRYRSQRLRRLWDAGFAAGATTYRIELIQMMENAGLKFTDVGPHAEEVINLFGVAIRIGMTAKDLKSTIFAYPTGASDIGHML